MFMTRSGVMPRDASVIESEPPTEQISGFNCSALNTRVFRFDGKDCLVVYQAIEPCVAWRGWNPGQDVRLHHTRPSQEDL